MGQHCPTAAVFCGRYLLEVRDLRGAINPEPRAFLFPVAAMSAAAEHIETMRQYLAMPSRDASLWSKMENNQRRALLMMAGLPVVWFSRRWESFTQRERTSLLVQVHDAGSWVGYLQGPA